jgi:hypothetical protein
MPIVTDPEQHYFRKPELEAVSRSALVSKLRSFIEFYRLKMKPWRDVDVHNGGMKVKM